MMTPAEQQHAMPFDLDAWDEIWSVWADAMETWEHIAEQDDSDEAAVTQALNRRWKELDAARNTTFYAGDGDCEW